jgi:type IV pilus secretin PilQ/predicted competence protein
MRFLNLFIMFSFLSNSFSFPLYAQSKNSPKQDNFDKEMTVSSDEGGPILETDEKSRNQEESEGAKIMANSNMPGTPAKTDSVSEAPLYEESESVSPLDRKIGPIRLKGAPLTTFLDVISAQSKINFLVGDDVENKTITVFLRKTTAREALEVLLRVKGLTYQRIGKSNTYIITKRSASAPNVITKVYTLSYIPLIPLGSVEQEKDSLVSQDVTSGNSQSSSPSKGGDGAVSIISILSSVLSKEHGKIVTDPRTNSLIITDIPEVFPQIEQIIFELDKKAPQILIEARIVEINTDRLNELGIEWGGSRGEMAYFAGPARLTDWGLRPGFFQNDSWKNLFPPTAELATTQTSASGSGSGSSAGAASSIDPIFATKQMSSKGVYYGVFSLAQLQAIFRALISRGEARYLGTPKVVAMNNKTSVIMVARDAALATQSVVTSAGGSTGSSSSQVERRRIGLTLQVTPQVNKEGYITLVVQPSYSDITASAITVQGSTVYDPVSRGVSTMVRVKNGQTVVIGGMLSSTEQKTVKKVPLLGYIPIIGWFFTSTSNRKTNTDLVVFITPTILVD